MTQIERGIWGHEEPLGKNEGNPNKAEILVNNNVLVLVHLLWPV